jgi:hypothetical protein
MSNIATVAADFRPKIRNPRTGLKMSATLATVFTILGHTVLGFEQPIVYVMIALLTGYFCAIVFESIDAISNSRSALFAGRGTFGMLDFLLSAHMTAITISFLLYSNQQFWVLSFAVAAAIGSKYLFRVQESGRLQHFLNPSNFGICLTLFLFRYTGLLPWNFSENTSRFAGWLLPIVILVLGFRLNLVFTRRIPLISAWLLTFLVQGTVRALLYHAPIQSQLLPLTGVPMVLFTLYMITDPQTTPSSVSSQIAFGVGVGIGYAAFLELHIVYGMFYSVLVVASVRGILIAVRSRQASRKLSLRSEKDLIPYSVGVGIRNVP